jgi:hypothetical protein
MTLAFGSTCSGSQVMLGRPGRQAGPSISSDDIAKCCKGGGIWQGCSLYSEWWGFRKDEVEKEEKKEVEEKEESKT